MVKFESRKHLFGKKGPTPRCAASRRRSCAEFFISSGAQLKQTVMAALEGSVDGLDGEDYVPMRKRTRNEAQWRGNKGKRNRAEGLDYAINVGDTHSASEAG